MANLGKIKATCKHCKEEFVLEMILVNADAIKSGAFPIQGAEFGCTHCGKFNTFTKEEVEAVA